MNSSMQAWVWRLRPVMAMAACALQSCAAGVGGVESDALGKPLEITRAELQIKPGQYVGYAGKLAATRAEFPQGFPRGMGSGVAFKAKRGDTLEFWVVGDRGPNGDGPEVGGRESKLFPVPDFAPAFGLMRLSPRGAELVSVTDIVSPGRGRLTGLPHPEGSLGATGEVPLAEDLTALNYDSGGVDSEGIAWDGAGLWVSDEYGPFVMKVDPATGAIKETLAPGTGLPEVFAKRRVNRGMELLSYDGSGRKLYGALQSPIDDGSVEIGGKSVAVRDGALFVRWVEVDPAAHTLREFAYPLDPADYKKGETGHAKLGDMAALGEGRFVVIEQGKDADGDEAHRLFLVDAAGATDIHPFQSADLERSSMLGRPVNQADWKAVQPLRKTLLLDLDRAGWPAEKAEGVALVDERTLVLTNDNDFGMSTALLDAQGQRLSEEVSRCRLSGQGSFSGGKCPKHAAAVAVVKLPDKATVQHVWLIRFAQPLSRY
ncbi:MAG: esterase-like activity of phytase family protein [Methylococcus sp.]|nr:esterase-like activity of phytase family protein [Methylococcus sp.]